MKIAILSDIHGNSVALRAVLEEMKKVCIDRIYVLGDMVGYYYHPDEVFDCLTHFDVEFLAGNHEKILLKCLYDENYLTEVNRKYGYGIKFAIEKLSREFCIRLAKFPCVKVNVIEGYKIALSHGSLKSINQYIYPDADSNILIEYTRSKYDYIFMGHTHYPFVFSKSNTVIANVGSVGQSREKSGLASWCVLDLKNGALMFKHTPYDVSQVIREAAEFNPKIEYLHEVLKR